MELLLPSPFADGGSLGVFIGSLVDLLESHGIRLLKDEEITELTKFIRDKPETYPVHFRRYKVSNFLSVIDKHLQSHSPDKEGTPYTPTRHVTREDFIVSVRDSLYEILGTQVLIRHHADGTSTLKMTLSSKELTASPPPEAMGTSLNLV